MFFMRLSESIIFAKRYLTVSGLASTATTLPFGLTRLAANFAYPPIYFLYLKLHLLYSDKNQDKQNTQIDYAINLTDEKFECVNSY